MISAAVLTSSSLLPYRSNSIGLSKDGPPKSGEISTNIPGISFTD